MNGSWNRPRGSEHGGVVSTIKEEEEGFVYKHISAWWTGDMAMGTIKIEFLREYGELNNKPYMKIILKL